MRRLLTLLKQPHPSNDDLRIYFRTITFIAFLVLFSLFIMRPFSLSHIHSNLEIFIRSFTYAGAGFVVMAINSLWIMFFPKLFRQEKWTLGKEIVFVFYQLITISTTIWLVNLGLNKQDENIVITSFWKSVWLASSTGMLPYFLVAAMRHFYLLKKNIQNVEKINASILSKTESSLQEETQNPILIINDPKIPSIHLNEFLFMESRGNYIHIFCEKHGRLNEYKNRNTVKEFHKTNQHIPAIFQCHRAYLINLNSILHIEGNAAGYLLQLHPEVKKVPVYRSKINEFNSVMSKTNTGKTPVFLK